MALNPPHGFGLRYDSARHQGTTWAGRCSGGCSEGLRIGVDTSLPAARVMRTLKEQVEVRTGLLRLRVIAGGARHDG